MTHQDIPVAGLAQPGIEQASVAWRVARKVVHADQVGAVAESAATGQLHQRPASEPADEPGLQGGGLPGRRQCDAKPGPPVRVALAEDVDQDVADDWKLVHMTMSVHVVRRSVDARFESVQLGVDLLAHASRVDGANTRSHDQPRQRSARTSCQGPFREIEMQAHVDPLAIQGPKRRGAAPPGRGGHLATHRADATHRSELHRR